MVTTTSATQMLLPAVAVQPLKTDVRLDALPPDAHLLGDPPPRDLVKSIATLRCLLQPVVLVAEQGGTYVVGDGRRRIKAAREVGLETVAALVFPPGSLSPDAVTLIGNNMRAPNPVSDYQAIATLLASGADEAAISAATGLTAQEIRARLRLETLIPPLKAALLRGDLRASVAGEAARLQAHQQETLAARLAGGEKVTLAEVRAARQVTREEAVAALPAALFGTPPAEEARPWRAEVGRLLLEARALVPGEATELRNALAAALVALQDTPDGEGVL
jgi:ParB/RepB/Spo0J family partition protein